MQIVRATSWLQSLAIDKVIAYLPAELAQRVGDHKGHQATVW
ncbi:hypothetical protein [Cupriavidus sp. PET2-C1]